MPLAAAPVMPRRPWPTLGSLQAASGTAHGDPGARWSCPSSCVSVLGGAADGAGVRHAMGFGTRRQLQRAVGLCMQQDSRLRRPAAACWPARQRPQRAVPRPAPVGTSFAVHHWQACQQYVRLMHSCKDCLGMTQIQKLYCSTYNKNHTRVKVHTHRLCASVAEPPRTRWQTHLIAKRRG